MQIYSNPKRELDDYALPDVEVFELTAREVAELDVELVQEYMRKREFKLATMNQCIRESMFDTIIEENNIIGGWYYWYCEPGCLPDSDPYGPYKTADEAKNAAQDEVCD